MPTLISCPQCHAVAEITDRFWLAGTGGPVEHFALRCVRRHHFRMPTFLLSGSELADDQVAAEQDQRDQGRPASGRDAARPRLVLVTGQQQQGQRLQCDIRLSRPHGPASGRSGRDGQNQ
jgi:hypothetical protein